MKIVFCILFGWCLSGYVFAGEATLAIAANFTNAARDIVPLFESATGHTVKVSFASTGKLYAQIENGAPFDVFLAADETRPSKAEIKHLAVKGSRFTYASGKLVLWSAKPDLFVDGQTYLKQGRFQRVALANPKTAPYGLAAQQAIEHLGVWKECQLRLVRGDSIAQVFQFVATGNAQAGFVALSQVKAWGDSGGSFWEIPQAYYSAISQQAVLLTRGEQNQAARAFLEFLRGDEARAVIAHYGYGIE